MKVYLLTEGQYSDYGVRAIFSSRENAERYIKAVRDTGGYEEFNPIIEWELDEDLSYAVRLEQGERFYQVTMRRDGSSSIYDSTSSAYLACEEVSIVPVGLIVKRWATSEEHAAKIANEIRAQKIASGELS